MACGFLRVTARIRWKTPSGYARRILKRKRLASEDQRGSTAQHDQNAGKLNRIGQAGGG
jgi:hypothetical protein